MQEGGPFSGGEERIHPMLRRQLARCGLAEDMLPGDEATWQRLLATVGRSYADAERARYLTERSIEISSREMQALNEALGAKKRELEGALEQLGENEARVRAILDNAADGIIVIGLDGRIQTWNHAAERIFGLSTEDAVGRELDVVLLLPKGGGPSERFAGYLTGGESDVVGRRREFTGRRQDGAIFPMDMYVSEVRGERIHVFTAIVRDISEAKEAERKLADTHRQLLAVSRMAGMAEVATSVLHNVGNVLNSVNVAAATTMERLQRSKLSGLSRIVDLLRLHGADMATFLTEDDRGRRLPSYLIKLSEHLFEERDVLLKEVGALQQGIEHMKNVIAMQQSYAKVAGVSEVLSLASLIEETLDFGAADFAVAGIELQRRFAPLPPLRVERHRLLQILVNLLSNARHAVQGGGGADKRITVRLSRNERGMVQIDVTDNGVGIAAENLTRIFSHGFTTKRDGHGFGLHSSALVARELGGELYCHSDGPGTGATFTLELPLELG